MQGIPLLFAQSGEALFFEGTKFPGRLLVAAFGFEREQTSWPTHVTFIPFLDLCLQNSRPADATPLDYEPGAVSVLSLASDSPVREIVLREAGREVGRATVAAGRAQLRMPDKPGLYAVSYDAGTEPERIFSVNPSPKESLLTYVESPEALKLWQLERGAEPARPLAATAPAQLSRAAILQQQIWWWLLLAGAVALLLEAVWTSVRKELV
jgi:hypothetical protein